MTEPGRREVPEFVRKLRARRTTHLQRGAIYRGAFVLAGFTVLLAGAAMLVLPGPAFVVIPIGLAMLALEFAWAERLLGGALQRAEQAREAAAGTSPRQRVLAGLAIGLALAAVLTATVAFDFDIPLIPWL